MDMNNNEEMLSRNFSLRELTRTTHSECDNTPGTREKENLRLLAQQLLQPLRDAWGKALTVNSGYRSAEVNKRVGGARNSYHMRGLAADIGCGTDSLKAMALAQICQRMNLPTAELIVSRRGATYWLHVALRLKGDGKKPTATIKNYG